MKFYLLIFFVLICSSLGFSQVSKVYITSKGNFSDNPKKSVSYVLIEKIADSAYMVREFDMHDTILNKGTYKDAAMTIPNGRFSYYAKEHVDDRIKNDLHVDTNTYLKSTGFFVDGIKAGTWIEYARRNVKSCMYTYQGGKINGLFQLYHFKFNNYVTEDGYYINDKREGEWRTYGYDTLKTPVVTTIYKNDKVIKTIRHIYQADFSESLEYYLTEKLTRYIDILKDHEINAEIIIDINGRVKEPRITRPIS
ncbi:MAG: hypothetical protein M3N14_10380, partial [Bacteroidota bacterium]|nr:hypothetical protein [Bacteroidota bacterium]